MLLPIQSIIQLDLGKQDQALETLSRALVLAEPEAYIRDFIDNGESMAILLSLAIQHDIQLNYCAKLLEAIEEEQDGKQELQLPQLEKILQLKPECSIT